jgi:phage FluMu gp28-like protein
MEIKKPERYGLLPYQSAFAANKSRFKIGLWARQTGKDHTCTFEAVVDSLRNPGTLWVIVAAGERQARESLSKAKEWAETLRFQIADYNEERVSPAARMQSAEIRWANGSRLLALPANPQTVRGYSANLILTEFAFHENPDALWRAVYPSISNPLRGGLKKLRIISTPNGMTNKFADLWFNTAGSSTTNGREISRIEGRNFEQERAEAGESQSLLTSAPTIIRPAEAGTPNGKFSGYFKSKVTIHDAIAAGLPLDAAELQAGLNDPDAWSQEYLCEFMDSSCVLFPYDLISPCESQEATESGVNLHELEAARRGQLFAGIDFGRKNHLTVCWILERVPAGNVWRQRQVGITAHPVALPLHGRGDQYVTREVVTIRNTATPDQLEMLLPRLRHWARICLDATGAGIGLGDYLVRQFGQYIPSPLGRGPGRGGKVELCQFSNALKGELLPKLRAAFENRSVSIPMSREIREDLHGVQRCVTQTGQISYRAAQSADGHSDRTTALALALRAGMSAPVSACAASVEIPKIWGWTWRNRRLTI